MKIREQTLLHRPRRLRTKEVLRNMVRETRTSITSLVYPMFLIEGTNIKEEIVSMPGQYRYSIDRMEEKLTDLLEAGVTNVMFFGIPKGKDEMGSGAYNPDGIVQRGLRKAKEISRDLYLIGDVCLCEYTSHGHCGILNVNNVDNDKTLKYLAETALSHVEAGADMVAPSDMMDHRVSTIRNCLDINQYKDVPIMSYAVKYASSFYGPFRIAADCAPAFSDRKSYQMDYHNRREGLKEAILDVKEGADIIMVKPAMAYGDIITDLKANTNLPIAAYSVSGEYAMVKAAVKAGFADETSMLCEIAMGAYRAGCDIYLTYFAKELANCMKEGRIG